MGSNCVNPILSFPTSTQLEVQQIFEFWKSQFSMLIIIYDFAIIWNMFDSNVWNAKNKNNIE